MANIFTHSIWKDIEKLNEKVRDTNMDQIGTQAYFLMEYLIKPCESPIEQLMMIEFAIESKSFERRRNAECLVNPQEKIKINNKTYRVDFEVVSFKDGKSHHIVVECDGHDFHEKTKEQAKRDKSRDRALQTAGYTVLRYTGSEVWADSYDCAREVFDVLESISGLKTDGVGTNEQRMDKTPQKNN